MNWFYFLAQLATALFFLGLAARRGKEALIAWIALQGVLANLFVLKQMDLFGLTVTCSDIFAVGVMLGTNLLQELHGKESARRCVWISFFALLCFTAMSQFHLLYQPFNSAYAAILSLQPRLIFASCIAFLISQHVDVRLFAFLRERFPKQFLGRLGGSLLFSQFLDTLLFTYLGLYGQVESPWQVIGFSYVVKAATVCLTSIVCAKGKKYVSV